jgi:hypothetical protein
MIADKELRIFQERNSLTYAPAVTRSVWGAAARAGVREFIPRRKHEVRGIDRKGRPRAARMASVRPRHA